MKILKVSQSYYPFLEKGGPTVKIRAIARGLAAAGHDVTVLSADQGFTAELKEIVKAKPNRWGWEAREDGVESVYLRTRARYRALTWNPGVAAFCRERLASYDLIHIYGIYDFLGPQIAKACRKLPRPYVIEPMGMFKPIIRNIRMKRTYHAVFGAAMLGSADRLIATADQERQELLSGGIPDHKIVVRRNGIDVPAELPVLGLFRDQWKIPQDSKLILFLGRLVSKKSPDVMLQAFVQWQRRANNSCPAVLVIAGPDEGDGFRQRLEGLAAKMCSNGTVRFTGPLYDAAKWAAYRDADLFVLPSQNENFGNTAAEAVACGTPVLVTDKCGIAPIIAGRAGLVVSHDSAALEAGLEKILMNPDLASRLREGCCEVARSLGWAEPLAQMESLYEELTSQRRAA